MSSLKDVNDLDAARVASAFVSELGLQVLEAASAGPEEVHSWDIAARALHATITSCSHNQSVLAAVEMAHQLSMSCAAFGVAYVHRYLTSRLAFGITASWPRFEISPHRGSTGIVYLGPATLWAPERCVATPTHLFVSQLLVPSEANDWQLFGFLPDVTHRGQMIAFQRRMPSHLKVCAGELLGLTELALQTAVLDCDFGPGDRVICADAEKAALLYADAKATGAILWGAVCLGIATAAFRWSLDYSRHRVAFGKPIAQHQAVAIRLADTALILESTCLLLRDAASSATTLNQERTEHIEHIYACAISDVWTAMIQTFRIAGGHGYLRRNPLEKYLRDFQTVRLLSELPILG